MKEMRNPVSNEKRTKWKSIRVIRGGYWNDDLDFLLVSGLHDDVQSRRIYTNGFRVVRNKNEESN